MLFQDWWAEYEECDSEKKKKIFWSLISGFQSQLLLL